MTVTVKHSKTNAISDWTQAQLDEQIALGNFAEGTVLADIVLPSDWNNDHTLTGLGTMAEQNANSVAITGGSINGTTIGATTASTGKFTSVTTPSVTATTTDLTLSAISTGNVNLATLGGTQFKAIEATGSVNIWNVRGGDGSTTSPRFTTEGTGTNIAGQFNTKGTGALQFFSGNTEQMRVTNTASAVNYVQVTGSSTGNQAVISVQGSDTNVPLAIAAKGSGTINLQQTTALGRSATNWLSVNGSSASGNAVQANIFGADTNVSMAFQPKGTGAIDLAAGSSGVNISNGGTVTAITRTAQGSAYTSAPTVAITAPTTAGGVQAVATAFINMQGTQTVVSGGTGYTLNDVLTIVGGTRPGGAATLTVTGVSGGVITSVSVTAAANYTTAPTNPASVTGGTGSGATFTLAWGLSTTFTITNAGSGYIEQPTITFSGGGGSGAAAYAVVGGNTTIKGIGITAGASITFSTPAGDVLKIADAGATTTNFLYAGTGVTPFITAQGTNAALALSSNGSGTLWLRTNGAGTNQMAVAHTASAVNYVQVTGSATGNAPLISAQGSDATVGLTIQAKGTNSVNIGNGNLYRVIEAVAPASSVNRIQISGNITNTAPIISAQGTDTNIDLALTPKGTGLVRFGTYVAGALTATGYINIKAADGTTYKVLVST